MENCWTLYRNELWKQHWTYILPRCKCSEHVCLSDTTEYLSFYCCLVHYCSNPYCFVGTTHMYTIHPNVKKCIYDLCMQNSAVNFTRTTFAAYVGDICLEDFLTYTFNVFYCISIQSPISSHVYIMLGIQILCRMFLYWIANCSISYSRKKGIPMYTGMMEAKRTLF